MASREITDFGLSGRFIAKSLRGWGRWLYPWGVRYADGGGLSAAGRQRRESVRMQAAELFKRKVKPLEVARQLRVSRKSAYQWHRLWRGGGERALASAGPGR